MTTAPADLTADRFRLGEWSVDPRAHELWSGDNLRRLQPRPMQLLLRLAREPGTLVSREQLLDEVWGGREVNDEVLSRAIAELRQLLGDDPRQPRYIETLPKLGYRLVASLAPFEPASMQSAPNAEIVNSPLVHNETIPPRGFAGAIIVFTAAVAAVVGLLATLLPPAPGEQQQAVDLRARLDRARPFATEAGFDQSARFSGDGRLIAWSASNVEQNRAHIWIAAHDGSDRHEFSSGDNWDMSPVFIEADKAVVFTRYSADRCELRRQGLLARESVALATCSPPPATSRIDVSPDGRQIAFAIGLGDDGRSGIGIVDLASGKVSALTDPGADAFVDTNPRYSGDGRQIAFSRGRHGEQRLWLAPVDAPSRARALLNTSGMLYGGAWLPGDMALILAGDLFGYRALYRVDAATGALEFLGARGARYPDVSRDGSIVYELADYQANLWQLDLSDLSAAPVALTQSQRYNNQPVFSPDGQWLAFASNRDGLEAVWLSRADGSDVRRLALDPALRWVRPTWIHNGTKLLVTAILNRNNGAECLPYACSSEHSALYEYDLDANRAQLVEGLGEDPRYARWSSDGAWLYFLRREGERNRLWRVARQTGDSPRLVIDASIDAFDLDSQHLALAIQGDSGIRVCTLEARDCHRYLQLDPEKVGNKLADSGLWLLHDDAIVFVARRPDGSTRLQRLTLADGFIVDISSITPNTLPPAMAISPDGRHLVYSRNDRVSIDLYLGEPANMGPTKSSAP
ncbi:MAG: winged helix-turn-helix domain-containing protein [Tahibacter sp.]